MCVVENGLLTNCKVPSTIKLYHSMDPQSGTIIGALYGYIVNGFNLSMVQCSHIVRQLSFVGPILMEWLRWWLYIFFYDSCMNLSFIQAAEIPLSWIIIDTAFPSIGTVAYALICCAVDFSLFRRLVTITSILFSNYFHSDFPTSPICKSYLLVCRWLL